MITTQTLPTLEERIWSALAHGSGILFVLGMPVPLIVWVTQRKKSGYPAFHSLQALGYQMISFMVLLILDLLVVVGGFFFMNFDAFVSSVNQTGTVNTADLFPAWYLIFLEAVSLGGLGLYALMSLIGAGATMMGRNFRYPWFGGWLTRYLRCQFPAESYPKFQLDEEQEDRFVSAMSHTSVILGPWGILLPLIAWVGEKERSKRLEFQTLQAILFQGFVLVASVAVGTCYLVGISAFIFSMLGSTSADAINPLTLILVLIVSLLAFVFLFLILPLFQILGQIAALRVLRSEYRYPLLGKWLEQRLTNWR